LTGRQQFSGETASHTMASVLKDEPDWDHFPTHIPPRVVELLRRCLHKHPKQRLQAIGEARVVWESYIANPQSFEVSAKTATDRVTQSTNRAQLLPWLITVLALSALAFVYIRGRAAPPIQKMSQRLAIPIGGETNFIENQASPPVISPDGRLIAYGMVDEQGVDQLWIRPIDSFDARPLEGTTGARYAFWSPDSRQLGFFLGGRLRRIEVATGRSQMIGGERAFLARGASWTSNDQILFAPNSNTGIWIVDAAGGDARQLTTPDSNIADSSHRWPYALPDGEHFLFLVWTNDAEALVEHGGVYLGSIDGSSEPRRIVSDASSVNYTTSGHLLVMQESNLVAIPFDADRQEITGDAFIVADGVLMNRNNGYASFSASEEGTLVFARGVGSIPSSSYVWADRSGELSDTAVKAGAMFSYIRLSPGATRAATTVPGPTGDPEVWILDLVRGVRSRLTPSAPYTFERPIWSPSGDRILYVSAKTGTWDLYTRNADGSGSEEPFLQSEFDKVAQDWNGSRVLYWIEDPGYAGSLFAIHDISTGKSTTIFEHKGSAPRPRFSPDGNYIFYDTTEDGRSEVVIHQIDGGARWQVSTNGGRFAHWRDDGREIVYLDPQRRVMTVNVSIDDASLTLSQPEELFQIVQNVIAWDVTGDHSRFLLATRPELASAPLHVILNWDAP
jgi:Tol biopolymer transport system component